MKHRIIEHDTFIEQQVAREILSMIDMIFFSEEYLEYRCNYGSNGARDLLIELIKERYGVNRGCSHEN